MPDCSRSWHPPWPRSGTRDTSTTTTLQRKLHATTKLYAHVHVHCPQGDHTASPFSVHVAICGRAAVCARNYVWVEICVELWKPDVRLSSKVSRFVLDWKGLGRERVGGWRAALFMCQPPGGLGHLGHLPPSCAVLRATNNFTNINTNTRDRAYMRTLMSFNVNTD